MWYLISQIAIHCQAFLLAQLKRKGCTIHEANFISFRSENLEFNSTTRFERCFNIIWRVLSVGSLLPRGVNPEKFCLAIWAEKYFSLLTKPKISVLQPMRVISLLCRSLFNAFVLPKISARHEIKAFDSLDSRIASYRFTYRSKRLPIDNHCTRVCKSSLM